MHHVHNRVLASSTLLLTLLLGGCGGGDSDDPTTIISQGKGGLMIGHYIETSSSDPDLDVGGFYVDLPSGEGLFKGEMSYHYAPCQDSNNQSIVGTKLGTQLNGTITGRLDNVSAADQVLAMTMDGDYASSNSNYSGDYSRTNRGNQVRTPAGCDFNYTVSNKGTFKVFAENQHAPSEFVITATTRLLTWPNISGAKKALVLLIDPSKTNDGDGLVDQQYVFAPSSLITLAASSSTAKTYIVSVQVFNANNTLLAYDNIRVTI